VFDDVELDLAVEAAIASAFKLSGQRCVSSGRMIVQRNVYDEFCRKFAEQASKLKTGNPFKADPSYAVVPDESVYYGPIINEQGFAKIRRMNSLVASDPKVEILLSPIYSGEHGSYYSTPMVYKREWTNCDSGFLRNEVFGPHVALIPFDTVEDAIHIYNDTEYGLAVGILTNDFRKARVMRDECDAGMIYWNGGSIAAESHLAFGGVKKSGNGFPSAARTYRAVTHEISWTVNHSDRLMFPQGMSK
jgi:aldehyde dehydrogenase (NAD+)